jgi:hypothetical protein
VGSYTVPKVVGSATQKQIDCSTVLLILHGGGAAKQSDVIDRRQCRAVFVTCSVCHVDIELNPLITIQSWRRKIDRSMDTIKKLNDSL